MVAGVSKLASFPVALPTSPLPQKCNPQEVACHFNDVLSRVDDPSTFVVDAVWRDTFAITGTLRTFYANDGVNQAWQDACRKSAAPIEGSLTIAHEAAKVTSLPSGNSWVEVTGKFQTRTRAGLVGNCTIMLNVVCCGPGEKWKIWTMRTVLEGIEGWPSVTQYSPKVNRTDAGHAVNGNATAVGSVYEVVVVGGGQCGLSTAGRLQALGIRYVLLDKYSRVGDSWATRYDSARLHTIREYSHLPFDRTFPAHYQEFLTKDDLARGYQDWTKKFGIDDHIWTDSNLLSGTWDASRRQWTLSIRRSGHAEQVRCRFVVIATGAGGQVPWMPDLPGKDDFQGIVLHSQAYRSAKDWKGKYGIVVGTANTAHDIADDMMQAEMASTTMIQRSKTYVMPYEYWEKVSSSTYNADFPTELADKLLMTGPNALSRLMANGALHSMAREQPERFEALEKAGFLVEPYGDIFWHLLERGGGHYMDVGTSKKIAEGKIKVKADSVPTHYTSTGLAFADGTELPADVIVWSTGFELNLKDSLRRFFGDDVADQTNDFFGIDDEGEVRGAWRLQHPGLITHGMALGQARFFSKYIALQIKAALEGQAFEQYLDTPVSPRLKDNGAANGVAK